MYDVNDVTSLGKIMRQGHLSEWRQKSYEVTFEYLSNLSIVFCPVKLPCKKSFKKSLLQHISSQKKSHLKRILKENKFTPEKSNHLKKNIFLREIKKSDLLERNQTFSKEIKSLQKKPFLERNIFSKEISS